MGVLFQQPLSCLFHDYSKETIQACITLHLCWESTSNWWFPVQKDSNAEVHLCHDLNHIIIYVWISYQTMAVWPDNTIYQDMVWYDIDQIHSRQVAMYDIYIYI